MIRRFSCGTLRARNPYPRNVNDVCSCEPRRLASLQYTIRVLSGCNASPVWRIPLLERGQHLAGLLLAGAVDDRVVHVAFGELPWACGDAQHERGCAEFTGRRYMASRSLQVVVEQQYGQLWSGSGVGAVSTVRLPDETPFAASSASGYLMTSDSSANPIEPEPGVGSPPDYKPASPGSADALPWQSPSPFDPYPRAALATRDRPVAVGDTLPGREFPLGATPCVHRGMAGTNFAITSSVAESVTLCLFDEGGTETRIRLRDNDADVWHAFVPGVGPGQLYGYRLAGPGIRCGACVATRPSCCWTHMRRQSAGPSRSA